METVITKIRGKVYPKDIIRQYGLEKTMSEFSILVKKELRDKMLENFLRPLHETLAGNKDYITNKIIIFNYPTKEDENMVHMGIIFWYANMKWIPDSLLLNPGRYSITVKAINNK